MGSWWRFHCCFYKFVLSFHSYKWDINYFLYIVGVVVLWCLTCCNNISASFSSQPLFQFGMVIPQCCCFKHNWKLTSATSQMLEGLSSEADTLGGSQNSFAAPVVFEKWIWQRLSGAKKTLVSIDVFLWYMLVLDAGVRFRQRSCFFPVGSFSQQFEVWLLILPENEHSGQN